MSGEPAGWSDEGFKSSAAALAAGRARYDGAIYTAWVVAMPYAEQMAPARDALAEMKERAAARGADVSCFDYLTDADVAVLDDLLRKTLVNWEAWMIEGKNGDPKRSTVVLVENRVRHEEAA
jgi:hypothetical protein